MFDSDFWIASAFYAFVISAVALVCITALTLACMLYRELPQAFRDALAVTLANVVVATRAIGRTLGWLCGTLWAYALWICKRCSPSAAERKSNDSVNDSKVTDDLDSTPTGAPLGGLRTPRLEEFMRGTTTARSASNAEAPARPRSVSRGRPANVATTQADAKKPGETEFILSKLATLETAIKTVSKRTDEMAQAPTPVSSANSGSASDASNTAVAAEERVRLPEPRTALQQQERPCALRPKMLESDSDLETWWIRFREYAALNHTPLATIKPLLLTFMGDSMLKRVQRVIENREYHDMEQLYIDIEAQFNTRDNDSYQLEQQFVNRVQFEDERLSSYHADLQEWAKRINKVKRGALSEASVDEEVKRRFIEGLHFKQIRIQLKLLFVTTNASSSTVLVWAEELQCTIVAEPNRYCEIYRTCAEFGRSRAKNEPPTGATKLSAETRGRRVQFAQNAVPPTWHANNTSVDASTTQESNWQYANSITTGAPATQASQTYARNRGPSQASICFNCRQPGHFARDCPARGQHGSRQDRGQRQRSPHPESGRSYAMNQQRAVAIMRPTNTTTASADSGSLPTNAVVRTNQVSLRNNHSSAHARNNPLDEKLSEVVANVELNGVKVAATFDTGSAITIIRESLWKRVARTSDKLRPLPFQVNSCAVEGRLKTRGTANCRIKCHGFSADIAVVVVADSDLAKQCLLGLNVVRKWPAMNEIFVKMGGVAGIELRQSARNKGRTATNQINLLLTQVIGKPAVRIQPGYSQAFQPEKRGSTRLQRCEGCDAMDHATIDCQCFQFNEINQTWAFSRHKLKNHTPNNEVWRLESELELDEATRNELLARYAQRKQKAREAGVCGLVECGVSAPGAADSNERVDVVIEAEDEQSTAEPIEHANQITITEATEAEHLENCEDGLSELCAFSNKEQVVAICCTSTVASSSPKATANNASDDIRKQLRERFDGIFYDEESQRRQVSMFEHKIELKEDAKPFKIPTRYAPFNLKEELRKVVQRLLDRGIIRESASNYASPLVLVRKKSGELRMCVDYRKLNEATKKDNYPIPRIDELIAELSGAEVFTTLDLAEGYYQIPIREEDREKTAFTTEFGLYEFTVMPFGLTNAPATFQRTMETILKRHIEEGRARVYLDDVVIKSAAKEQHANDVIAVCEDIHAANLCLKENKCDFASDEVAFLGHTIRKGRVLPAPSKLAAVNNFSVPRSITQLKGFLGLTGYLRKFIKNYATIAAPLNDATKGSNTRKENRKPPQWGPEQQDAFEKLKKCLTSTVADEPAGVLALPDFNKDFVFKSDASNVGIGAYISQRDDVTSALRPVMFWSRKLSEREQRYATSEKELMAIILGIEFFKPYLYGRKFTVMTDHKPLAWLRDHAKPSCRLARWLIKVREFDFKIEFISGVQNVVADALSRFFLEDTCEPDERDGDDPGIVLNSIITIPHTLNIKQATDPDIARLFQWLTGGEEIPQELGEDATIELKKYHRAHATFKCIRGTIYKETRDEHGDTSFRYVVPREERTNIINSLHNQPLAGHLNNETVSRKVNARFYWPRSWSEIKAHCQQCHECATSKTATHNAPQMIPIEVTQPFELVTFDIMGPIAPVTAEGNRYILVMLDHFTKWAEAFALKDQKAQTVANIIFSEYICRHGCPRRFLSDQGTNFNAEVMDQLAALLDIDKAHTTPYRPQCDGLSERFNRTLGAMLRTVTHEFPNEWDNYLKPLCFAYNTAVHKTTGVQPFVMLYGRFPRLPLDLVYETEPIEHELVESEYAEQLCNKLLKVYEVVREYREVQVERQKFFHDRRVKCAVYELGDRVYCRNEAPPQRGTSKKLSAKYDGPFTVIERVTIADSAGNEIFNYRIRPDGRGRARLVHASKLKKCYGPRVERIEPTRRRRNSAQVTASPSESEQSTQHEQQPSRHEPSATESDDEERVDRDEHIDDDTDDDTNDELTRLDEFVAQDESTDDDREDNALLAQVADELNLEPQGEDDVDVDNDDEFEPNAYYARQMAETATASPTRTRRERRPVQRYDASRHY